MNEIHCLLEQSLQIYLHLTLHQKVKSSCKMLILLDLMHTRDGSAILFDDTKQAAHGSHIMTSSNGNILRVTDPLCGNSPVPGE